MIPACQGAKAGFTNLVCTEVKISMSVKGGILSGKASNIVASTWTSFMSLENGQAESTWSIFHEQHFCALTGNSVRIRAI